MSFLSFSSQKYGKMKTENERLKVKNSKNSMTHAHTCLRAFFLCSKRHQKTQKLLIKTQNRSFAITPHCGIVSMLATAEALASQRRQHTAHIIATT